MNHLTKTVTATARRRKGIAKEGKTFGASLCVKTQRSQSIFPQIALLSFARPSLRLRAFAVKV
jgi:hypothetical protein